MNSQDMTQFLGGRWYGRYGSAPCPVCQPERRKGQNALTLADGRDGRLLLHCKKAGCTFTDIASAAGIRSGDYRPPDPLVIAERDREYQAQVEKRARQAEICWQEALPITDTPAERYLRGRGIICDLPETLRYHPSCWHVSAKRFPALLGLIEGSDSFAVHRTYLRADGSGKAAVEPEKAMLGNVAGGAVRVASGQGAMLIVGEGIENTLSAHILRNEPTATAWAALSTSGMRRLRLPELGSIETSCPPLIVAIDNDPAGRAAGDELAEKAHALGWQVAIMSPGKSGDLNEVLCAQIEGRKGRVA